jgi:hypothetical protein
MEYRPARLHVHRLMELIPWNQFLGSLKLQNSGSAFADIIIKIVFGSEY